MDLIFNNTQDREEIKEILTHYINSQTVPVSISLPAALTYGEDGDSKLMFFYHPHKLGESIHDVLNAAKDVHDWHASVYFDPDTGITLVFFTAQDQISIPDVFVSDVVGTA